MTDSEPDLSSNESSYSLGDSVQQRRRKRLLPIAGLIAIGVLLATVFFFITNIQIVVAPADASAQKELFRVTGALFTWGDDVLMFGKRGTVGVSSPGYVDAEIVVDTGDPSPIRNITLEPLPGRVTIHVDAPQPFTLAIDGERVNSGSWPLQTELDQGPHTLTLAGRTIQTESSVIEVEGYGVQQEFHISSTTSNSFVSLSTQPPTASILLDGNDVGIGNFEGRVGTGRHQIELFAEGHDNKVLQLDIGNDERIDLGQIVLQPLMATLNVQSQPPNAAVILNGEFVGSTPIDVSLAPSTDHDLSIRKQTFEPVHTSVTLQPGTKVSRKFDLALETARIEVEANLAAEVHLNQKRIGTTPTTLNVAVGDVITVAKEGYASQSRKIVALDDSISTLKFELLTKTESIYRSAPDQITVIGSLKLAKFPKVTVHIPITIESATSATGMRSFQLTRPFYIGVHEVTNSEFERFNAGGNTSKQPARHPVQNVAWNDAVRFCNWLSAQESLDPAYLMDSATGSYKLNPQSLAYRLPTEAEWEAVAAHDFSSGRQLGPFLWGDSQNVPRGSGNFAGREVAGDQLPFLSSYVDNHSGLAPVGSYSRNSNGIHDLAGNISEWVHDHYAGQSFGLNANLVDPLGPEKGLDHIVKGASFRTCRLEEMYTHLRKVKTNASPEVGFRVAKWIY